MAVLRLKGLGKTYQVRQNLSLRYSRIRAVDDVNLTLGAGQTLGLVGESGSGKSTLARMVLRLLEPSEGEIYLAGREITRLSEQEFRPLRQNLQIVFQDPFSSLSPRLPIKEIVAEPLRAFNRPNPVSRVKELLELVGLDAGYAGRLPNQLSGGERQRVSIARALALNPEVLILDEPVSSLDLSTQAQILNLLKRLQLKFNLSYLFIAHNLTVVRYFCQQVAVMYRGRIVETGPAETVYSSPIHPYTRNLISCVPKLKQENRAIEPLQWQEEQEGCPVREGCRVRGSECFKKKPPLVEFSPGRQVCCHRPELLISSVLEKGSERDV